jgi:uroporphyrinogen-III synthase
MLARQTLKGLRVLVTRPAHQAAQLCELIRAAGGIPVMLPVLAIAEPEDLNSARAQVARLRDFAIAIFVSANAAEKGMDLIREHGALPAHLNIAAVGQRTAEALLQHGGRIDIQAPPPYNSEALLATPELLDVKGKDIVIFRGSGGRELLAEALRQRGAMVVYAEVYRRVKPEGRLADIVQQTGDIEIVVVTSQDGLRNLMEMADMEKRRTWLLSKQLVAISARVADLACEMGFKNPALVAETATDQSLVNAMIAWRHGGQSEQ